MGESPDFLPRVLVVTLNPQHRETFEKILRPYFQLAIFRTVDEAMDEAAKNHAQVIVIDQNGRRDRNSASFLDHVSRLKQHCPGLIATVGAGIEFDIDKAHLRLPSRFLNWPFKPKQLLDAVSQVIGEKAEFTWKLMPKEIGRPLTVTVEEYQSISDAIANG